MGGMTAIHPPPREWELRLEKCMYIVMTEIENVLFLLLSPTEFPKLIVLEKWECNFFAWNFIFFFKKVVN